MCDFGISAAAMMAAASAATAVAGTVVSAQAAQHQAFAQASYQNDMYEQTGKAAQANYIQQMGVENDRLEQANQAYSQQSLANRLQGAQAVAHASAASDAAGVGGRSVQDLYQDFGAIQARNQDSLNINQSFGQMQAMQEEKAMAANAKNHIAGAMPGPINYPNSFGVALSAFGSAANAGDTYMKNNNMGSYNPANRTVASANYANFTANNPGQWSNQNFNQLKGAGNSATWSTRDFNLMNNIQS